MDNNEIVVDFYNGNAKKLRNMVNKILLKFGGISQKDYDDFYSLANEVFTNLLNTYDGSINFDGYLYSCLSNKIKTEFTRRNREKRKTDRNSISIDAPIGEDEGSTLADTLASDFSIERELSDEIGISGDEKVEKYLGKLSRKQRKIVFLLSNGYNSLEVKDKLHIKDKDYVDCMNAIRSYEYIKILM